MAEARAFAGTLDEARDVGHHERLLAARNDTEVGDERGERIVGDLGTRRTHPCDQRRLTHARESHKRGIRQQLQLELDPPFLARFAELREGGGPACRRGEMPIAPASPATAHDHQALPVVRQVTEHLARLGIAHDGTPRHRQHQVVTVGSVTLGTLAVRPPLRLEVPLVVVVDEGRERVVGLQDHVAAVAAITAVGTAFGHMRLATERRASRATVTRLHMNLHFVYEHDRSNPR